MKVACIQLSSGEDYNKNLKDIVKYINQAIEHIYNNPPLRRRPLGVQ